MKNNRIDVFEKSARQKAFQEHDIFWGQFSDDELIRFVNGDIEVTQKYYSLGGERINRNYRLALSPHERKKFDAEINRIAEELKNRDNEELSTTSIKM